MNFHILYISDISDATEAISSLLNIFLTQPDYVSCLPQYIWNFVYSFRADFVFGISGNFKKGVPHGYFRYLDATGDLEFFGCFVRGIGHGLFWRGEAMHSWKCEAVDISREVKSYSLLEW